MAFSRYIRDDFGPNGGGLAVAQGVSALRRALALGIVPIKQQIVTTQADRLDTLAGELLGDGKYWWILAAASNIGWGLQVPPDTIINVPDLRAVERLVG